MEEAENDITILLKRWLYGDRGAEQEVFDALYQRLHSLAAACLHNEPNAGSLGPTALVHEAYIRLVNAGGIAIEDRKHFLALAATVMRRVIVDRARRMRSGKRGGAEQAGPLDENVAGLDRDIAQVLAVDAAMDQLFAHSPRQARLVEMRYFGGFSLEETASALGISTRTAKRDWQVARLRLKDTLDGGTAL